MDNFLDTTPDPASRWYDLPAAALLMAAAVTAATRLVATEWTTDLTVVQTLAFLGVIAGLALGQSRFKPRLAGLLALIYGLFAVPWQLGLTLTRDGGAWGARLESLALRLIVIFAQLYEREVVRDSLLFLVVMAVLFWILGAQAGYTLTRYGNAWGAILPTGLALFTIHSFDALIPRRAWFLAVYLFFALVLVARVAYLHHAHRWQTSRTALPPHLGLDFIRFTLLAVSGLVVFAWTVPALASSFPLAERALQTIKQPYTEWRAEMDNVFASLRSSAGVVSDYYGSSITLGRGNRLGDQPVLKALPVGAVPEDTRLYWRARAYDTYRSGQWVNTAATTRLFDPESGLIQNPNETGRTPLIFEITPYTYVSTMFSAPQPLWVSAPAQVEAANNADGTVDVSAFRAQPGLSPGDVYRAQASLTSATEAEMRAAGTDYPAWVTERYLAVPDSLTPRMQELAERLTASEPTPYDKARAVTNYLRRTITYSEFMPELPRGQEPLDWFLFDVQAGFCNYYASSEVVLLRAVGVPARWSVGYAQGELQADGSYLVRQNEAHAWPEVYFPGVGWVEFEPTSAQPALLRPIGVTDGASDSDLAERQQLEEELRAQREDRELGAAAAEAAAANPSAPASRFNFWWLIPAAGLLFAAWKLARLQFNLPPLPVLLESWLQRLGVRPPAALRRWAARAASTSARPNRLPPLPILIERTLQRLGLRSPEFIRRWVKFATLPVVTRSYLEINRGLQRLGAPAAYHFTPNERAAALGELAPATQDPAQQLVYEYQVATFSPQPPDEARAQAAGADVRRLTWRAWFGRWLKKLQKPANPARDRLTRR